MLWLLCTLAPLAVAPEVNALCRSDDPQAAHPVLLSQELEQPLAVGRLVVNAWSISFAEWIFQTSLLGCASACRESFRVFTFRYCNMTKPAGRYTYCRSKARYLSSIFRKISPYKQMRNPVLYFYYRPAQKKSPLFEIPTFLPPTNLGQLMHSQSALM